MGNSMKIMIKYRLFLAMLTASAVVVICMFLIMQWSIGRGFLAYVNTIEMERFDKLGEVLEQSYTSRGDWQFLRDDPEVWSGLVSSTLPREWSEWDRMRQQGPARQGRMRRGPAFENQSGPQPPRLLHRFEARVVLLDEGRQRVAGGSGLSEPLRYKRLIAAGHTIGFLGLQPRQRLTDSRQLLFVQQQKLTLALIACVMLLVSAALSLPLANRLVSPIKRLAASLHRLASGDYQARIPEGPLDELGLLARDCNTLALSLEKNERARRLWVADISHELRTPLAILRGEIEAIQDGVRQAGPESMRSLHAEVMRLSRLVDDLYQLSLYDIGALTYRKTDLDLAEELGDALAAFAPELEQKGIALKTRLPETGSWPVFADPGRLHQLFDNLLENALKYTDAGGELTVTLKRNGERAVVELSDSAPGVPPEDLERLFDRLYRVESSRNRALGGAGLGLAICKNIVEAHEGSIRALPSPAGGVTISIELPLTGSTT
jgi:two-component system sensor histidine kinase BaeS